MDISPPSKESHSPSLCHWVYRGLLCGHLHWLPSLALSTMNSSISRQDEGRSASPMVPMPLHVLACLHAHCKIPVGMVMAPLFCEGRGSLIVQHGQQAVYGEVQLSSDPSAFARALHSYMTWSSSGVCWSWGPGRGKMQDSKLSCLPVQGKS